MASALLSPKLLELCRPAKALSIEISPEKQA
jgi:hypothetical protein